MAVTALPTYDGNLADIHDGLGPSETKTFSLRPLTEQGMLQLGGSAEDGEDQLVVASALGLSKAS